MLSAWRMCLLFLVLVVGTPASAGSSDDVRSRFDEFVSAQNAHDLAAVKQLLAEGPEFVWVTRGIVVRGRSAALARFQELYRGTWYLTVTSSAETSDIDDDTTQVLAPVTFTMGPPGRPAKESRFLLAQIWRRKDGAWKLVSNLPIPIPQQ